MDRKEAIATLESLIESVMAAGAFKKFETLDKCREAISIMKAMDKVIELSANEDDQT